MSARRLAALLGVVFAVLALAGAAPSAATPRAQDATLTQPEPDPESAVERFSGCLSAAHAGQVLVLIDESGSLVGSDPHAARVQAARYLLTRLADLADRSGIRLTTGVAGFADRFDPPPSWQPLGKGTLPGFTAQLDGFAGRHSGTATDYWTALEQSRRALAAQAPPGPAAARCQGLFFFSDGRLDLVPGHGATDPITHTPLSTEADANAAEARERDALCTPDGDALVDQLRAAGVITFGIGLDTDSRPGDFDLMRAIATGSAGPTRCGKPPSRTPGEFRLASGIDDLVFGFDDLIPPEPLGDAQRPVCPGTPCPAGRHSFVLDPSVSRVDILGAADRPGVDAVLVPPDGNPIPLQPHTADGATVTRGPAGVRFRWLTDRTVSVQMDPSSRDAGWSGEWALVFVDPTGNGGGRSHANVHLTSDLAPAWTNRPGVLHSGQVISGATFGLVDPHGSPVDPAVVRGDVRLDATLLAQGRPAQPLATGLDKAHLGAPTTVDLRPVPPGPVSLRLTLHQTTAPTTRPDGTPVPGTALPPRSVTLPLQIAGPVGYPQPAASVDFGTGDQATELTATLAVTGPGCAWVPDQQPGLDAAPRDTGRITVAAATARDPGSCLRLTEGQHGDLRLVLHTEHPGDGTLSGTLNVLVTPPGDPGAVRTVPVTATANLLLPLDRPLFVGVFVAVFLLGLAIPLGLLWLFKYLTGRLPAGQVSTARVRVRERDGVVTFPDGSPFTLGDDAFRADAVPEPGRRQMWVQGVELRTGGWRSPFGSAHVRVGEGTGQTVLAPSGLGARLPLGVHDTWFALHNPADPPQEAEVVVVLGLTPAPDPGALTTILTQIRDRLPRMLRALSTNSAPPVRPGGPPGPSGPSGPSGPPGPSVPTPLGQHLFGQQTPAQQNPPPNLFGAAPPGGPPYGRRP